MKRTINAKQVMADIKSGMSDAQLMEKYEVDSRGMQSLLQKLLAARLITTEDLANRTPFAHRTVSLEVHRCPACGMPQFTKFEECPQCGVIISKFVKTVQPRTETDAMDSRPQLASQTRQRAGPAAISAAARVSFPDQTPPAPAAPRALPAPEPQPPPAESGFTVSVTLPPDLYRELSRLTGVLSNHMISAVKLYLKDKTGKQL